MPFDLYISRATTFGASSPRPITSEELQGAMSGAPATRKADHVYWVRHPDGDPWFVVEWKAGQVLLSTSYSHHRYLRNFPDMFDQGLVLAESLGARLFEEVEQREVTRSNVDELLHPDGKYVELQAGTWRGAMDRLARQANAPLEYPLGPFDVVSEYLVFHLAPARPIEDDAVPALLERATSGVKVHAAREGTWCAIEVAGERWLTKILRRADGQWQIWPAWGQSPFPGIAATTVAVAEELHRAAGGELRFLGRPYDDSLRESVHARLDGLGVDFYLWTQELG